MKKALAIILTIGLFVFGTSFVGVQANDSNQGEDFPDAYLPYDMNQG